jgi:hypothetical protein
LFYKNNLHLLHPSATAHWVLLENILAFAKRPAPEKTKFLKNREVKVKRSCYGVGVALLCSFWASSPTGASMATVPRFFFTLTHCGAGET